MGVVSMVADVMGLSDRMEIKNSVIIELDATLFRETSMEAEVTESPVESGADISDNINIKPVTIRVEGFVSDDPISFAQQVKDAFSGDLKIGGEIGDIVNGNAGRSKTCYDALKDVFTNKHRCMITHRFDTFDNMIMTSLSVPESPATGRAIEFSATFKQISVAYLTVADAIKIEGKNKAKGVLNKGKQAVKSAAGTVTEKKSSLLLDGLQGLGLVR